MCQLSRALGLHHSLNPEGKLRLITELKAHYRHGLKFGKSSDDLREKLSADLRIGRFEAGVVIFLGEDMYFTSSLFPHVS